MATLHWRFGMNLFLSGARKIYERVTMYLPDLLGHGLDLVFLYFVRVRLSIS